MVVAVNEKKKKNLDRDWEVLNRRWRSQRMAEDEDRFTMMFCHEALA